MAIMVTAVDVPGDIQAFAVLKELYQAVSDKPPAPALVLPEPAHELARTVYGALGAQVEIETAPPYMFPLVPRLDLAQSNTIAVVPYSGGKDSLAVALRLQQRGLDVHLFHVRGANRSSPKEYLAAEAQAKRAGFPLYTGQIRLNGTSPYADNPVKNQLLLAAAVAYGTTIGATHYALGDFYTDKIATSSAEVNLSDAYEVIEASLPIYRAVVPGFTYHHVLKNYTASYITLRDMRPDLFEGVASCVAPARFAGGYRKTNERRYGVRLREGECGSCWKCCVDFYVHAHLALRDWDAAYAHHGADYLRSKWQREKPHLAHIDPWALSDAEVWGHFCDQAALREWRVARGLVPELLS